MINLIVNNNVSHHVSDDVVKEIENIILSDHEVQLSNGDGIITRFFGALAWRLYECISFKSKFLAPKYLCIPIKGEHFAVLMGLRFRKCMPYFVFSKKKHLYLFDAWPHYHDKINEFTRLYKIRTVFVTSSQVAERLKKWDGCTVHWMPEGIDPSGYHFYDYRYKNIDILEFGRKYPPYHHAIRDFLAKHGKIHLYEKKEGDLVFPTRTSFIDGLARSKISICFPSNITHPERAENIETITIRYLQSMLSKCLIVGHAPLEMVRLFGYNPVVEMDDNNPCAQLVELLKDHDNFIPLIERNYHEVHKNHTWERRWEEMKRLLFENMLLLREE